MSVGDIAAEYDELLLENFLDTGEISQLRNTSNPKSVIVGRTGAGKTALITVLERQEERVLRINPENLSMHYLTNTTIIPYLVSLDVRLDPFFQLLWRHVLVMELIRDHFKLRDEEGQKSFFRKIQDIFGRKSERDALEYYKQWNPEFWESSDVRVRQITSAFEQKFDSKLGITGAQASAGGALSEEIKQEEVQRAHRIVKEVSLETISVGMEIVKQKVLADRQKPYFIVIDDLDKKWIDSELAYSLIENLLDVVGDFAKMQNVKVLVALRDNIVEALHHRRGRQRQQREKHESLFLRLRWSPNELTELVDKRLETIMRGQHGGTVSLNTLLPETRGKKERSGLEFVLERTFKRPRDLIDFVNHCVQQAATSNSNKITWQILTDAERAYSTGRLKSLEDEWYDTYPDIGVVFRAFDGIRDGFTATEIDENRLTDILIHGERATELGSLARIAYDMSEQGNTEREIWGALMPYLYRVSFVGVKVSPREPTLYSYDSGAVATDQLTPDSRFFIHPGLHRALHLDGQ